MREVQDEEGVMLQGTAARRTAKDGGATMNGGLETRDEHEGEGGASWAARRPSKS